MARQIKTQLVVEGKNNASRALREADGQLLNLSATAKKAGAALLATFSVGAISTWIKSSINAADESRKLAQAAGVTTESFTGLQFAASQSGVATAGLAASLARLNRSLSDAASRGGRPAEIFAQLGVATRDAEGGLRSADAVLMDLADVFQTMPDGAQKSAIALELLGRSGAQLIPLLNGGSEGIRALTEQAERLGLVISDEQAAASERFNDTIAALGGASRGAANTVSGELLPTLNEMSGLLLDVVENGESAKTMANVLSFALKSLATIAVAVGVTFGNLGRLIGATAAAAAAAASGDFAEAGQIFREVSADNERATRESEERIKKIWDGSFAESGAVAAQVAGDFAEIERVARENAERANRAFADSYNNMLTSAKSALQELVREEKRAQAENESIRKKRIDIESRYADALNRFRGFGQPEEASVRNALSLKLGARQALAAGDYEDAQRQASAALQMLLDLQRAGANTYGFAGVAAELQQIELAANDIEQSQAEEKLKSIADQVAVLNQQIAGLTEFDIKLELTEAEKQKIIDQMEALRQLLGQPIPIQTQLQTAGAGDTPAFATGGRVSGPGTGTSDSILARLSNGEYVVKAAAVRKYGTHLLDSLNGMRLPKYADGGLVGAVAGAAGGGSTLNLSLDGQSYRLSAQADTIEALANAVRRANLTKRR